MKSWKVTLPFDGAKFAERYQLGQFDYSMNGDTLTVKDESKITDDPPIFEAPDAPKPPIKQRIDAARNLDELKALLKEVL